MIPNRPQWIIGIAVAFVVVTALGSSAAIVYRLLNSRRDRVTSPAESAFSSQLRSPPIEAEAAVFRAPTAAFAVEPQGVRRDFAHRRTMETWKKLRAFPGAPPRIPHGLTSREFQTVTCNVCHQRGGYSQRFGAYAPVTPHPEQRACTQCHLSDAAVTGVLLPLGQAGPEARCRQCHSPTAAPGVRADTASPVPDARWPRLADRNTSTPQPIPHELRMRANCLACHSGPGAVLELRTDHPDQSNCRQCHVLAEDVR